MRLDEVFKRASHTDISELKALELMKSHARNAHDAAKKTPAYISIKEEHPFILVEPTKSVRKTPYLLDSLVDELPSWKHFSKRMTSLLAYTDDELAEKRNAQGKLYLALPFDMTHVCVSPRASFYSSFEHAAHRMHIDKLDNSGIFEWLASLKEVCAALEISVKEEEPGSFSRFQAQLHALEPLKGHELKKKLDDLTVSDVAKRRALDVIERRGTIMNHMSELLDPDTNKFIRLHASHHFIPTEREVWTSGSTLLIAVDAYERLHARGDIK